MKISAFKSRSIVALLVGILLPVHSAVLAQPSPLTEYEIKAAFLYNFAKFVEWPSDAFKNSGDAFVIGVLGEDPFGDAIEGELKGKSIQDKKLVFKRLSDPQEAPSCHVVYVSVSEREHLDTILNKLRAAPVLTVSDMKGFIQRGGMIGLFLDKNKVAFSINQTVAESTGLKISSQLLKLAKTIARTLLGKSLA
jgi:hypothetical protein